ncbi:AraC family transcriptional regulator [Streptomyces griseocarneus]|nr:AraC family transcriptional regulator [Streptomyces griseocarneus]
MGDTLSSLLRDVRPVGALFDKSVVDPPWSVLFTNDTNDTDDIGDASVLYLLSMLSGDAWVTPDAGEPVPLRTGDMALLLGPRPFTVADDPDTAPLAVVNSSGYCTTPDGYAVVEGLPTCRSEEPPGGAAMLLVVAYQVPGRAGRRVLDALPPCARIPACPDGCPALDMLVHEVRQDVPGQEVVLDRLLDLLLVACLREWFNLPTTDAPAWYRAHGDPVVGRALHLIHGDPAHPWTVAGLAARAGVSRAAFAERFTRLVGRPPMAYLTEWRLCRAADLLATTDATVGAVARQVGYSSSYALSTAFKRTLGVRPTEHRARYVNGGAPTPGAPPSRATA